MDKYYFYVANKVGVGRVQTSGVFVYSDDCTPIYISEDILKHVSEQNDNEKFILTAFNEV